MILVLLSLVFTAACAFLILVILLQSGKGSGLSGMLGGANPLTDSLGASGAEKTLTKWTTVSAILFFVLSLALTLLGGRMLKQTKLSDQLKAAAAPVATPAATTPAAAPEAAEATPAAEAVAPETTPAAAAASEATPAEAAAPAESK
ncbi:MAG TPA: preprotein translocase subunit SecG [Candidatus Sumerlaeota bacterium]|nr:MAG: preprotein translocase subunit SecG [candidate division BRC1 bacterium ADurb.Bin183]HOE63501.1 preprotein translocase subunit SecG [Candidatus Sumerlaeota bacterium]HRR31448.1 preprotein translocase subunit SecG [Candidatus Sumerlaeia bacterium]HON51384.1 preprotein translocase subunit SecG [Candidatus Sumerlaeota bacterium]HOR64563.1 preprotein translocase subunit SecG [Candidatus Sumerlaeota bacterium]